MGAQINCICWDCRMEIVKYRKRQRQRLWQPQHPVIENTKIDNLLFVFSHTNCFDGISIRATQHRFGGHCHCESQFVIVSIILTPFRIRQKSARGEKRRKKRARYQRKQNDLTQIIGELCAYKLSLGS